MAVSRPVLLALLGAVLAGALFFATMGSRNAGESSGPAEEAAPPAKVERPGKVDQPAKDQPAKDQPAKVDRPAKDRPAKAERRRAPATKAGPAPPKREPAAPAGVPAAVRRALDRGRTVVLFFYQRGSADDEATARAVASVRGRPGVKVFSAPTSRLADYRGITSGTGLSRAPAVLILRRAGRARLVEGFIDRKTLAQEVADAR